MPVNCVQCSCSKQCMCGVAPVLYLFSNRLVNVALVLLVVGTVGNYGNDSIAGMNHLLRELIRSVLRQTLREWIESIDRSREWMIDSFAIARISFFLLSSTTVRPATGVTKTDTFWRICTHSRDLNFCRIDLGLGRVLFSNTNLSERSIKKGGNFHFFGKIGTQV